MDFSPYGYGERQYCSPGFNLPVGRRSSDTARPLPQYHTSADDLEFVRPAQLAGSFAACLAIIDILENRANLRQPEPEGRATARPSWAVSRARRHEMALLWVLNQSDGTHSLLDIAERSGCAFSAIRRAATALERHGLLKAQEAAERRERR